MGALLCYLDRLLCRFYFENEHVTGPGFTVGEVAELKDMRLHHILRRNTFLNDLNFGTGLIGIWMLLKVR